VSGFGISLKVGGMSKVLRRFWILLPILASTATECDETPRGAVPSLIAPAELVLVSQVEELPVDDPLFQICLSRMEQVLPHVRPSWRASPAEPGGQIVVLEERPPASNRFVANFLDVPVDFMNIMTVHDVNECARDPLKDGHVTMGVFINGTEITQVVGDNGALGFRLNADGSVQPAPPTSPAP